MALGKTMLTEDKFKYRSQPRLRLLCSREGEDDRKYP